PEWQDQDPPPRGDPAPPRHQRNDTPGEGQGIGIVARNRSAALRTPEGRSMKTSRFGFAAGPSHSPSRTHARQVTIPQPNKQQSRRDRNTNRNTTGDRKEHPHGHDACRPSLSPRRAPRTRRAPDPRPGTGVRADQGPG